MIQDTLFNLNDITGSGKTPKQHTPVEYPDTGSSTQVAKLLIMLSEGEIEGFEASDVYLKQVPATEYSVDIVSRRGLPDQEVISGFAEVYAPLAATSAAITKGDEIGHHVIIAVPNTNDAVILTQTINALYNIEANGDTISNTVSLDYYVSTDGSNWGLAVTNKTITAKYSSGYAFSVTVTRPVGVVGNVWYAKIVRLTDDSTSNKSQNATSFSQAIGIIYKNLAYDYKALLGITLKDAKQFGGSIPEILIKAKGIKVEVPANYDTTTRDYATAGVGTINGGWGGMFAAAKAWTDNPAWCLLHCLTDVRVGLGLDYDSIDIFAFYDLAKYCDGLVDISEVSVSINEVPDVIDASFTKTLVDYYYTDGTVTTIWYPAKTLNYARYLLTINNNINTAIGYNIFNSSDPAFESPTPSLVASINIQPGSYTFYYINVYESSFNITYHTTYFRIDAIQQNTIGTSTLSRTEPRYTINAQFITRENLNTFFMYFLTLMNANWTTNEFGQLSLMWDNENQQPSKQATNATIIDGVFNYSSTDLEQRFNHVNVTFSDPAAFGRTNTVSVPEVDQNGVGLTTVDRAAIASQSRYGFQQLDLVLVGCTSRAQAIRKARWALYNSCFLYNIIDFKVLFEGMIYKIGEIVSVCDNFNQEDLIAGIFVSHDEVGTDWEVKLDRELTLVVDTEYTLTYLSLADASQVSVTLTRTTGENSFSSFLIPISGSIEPLNSTFIVHPTEVKPKLYKVIKITKDDDVYNVVAIEHHDGVYDLGYGIINTLSKYDYIDGTVTINKPSGDYGNISYEVIQPIPDNSISVLPRYAIDAVSDQLVRSLEVTWTAPTNPITLDGKIENRIFNYSIGISRPKTPGTFETHEVPSTSYTIENTEFGTYKINIAVVDATNERSSALKEYIYEFTTSGISALLPPTNLVVKDTSVTTFTESDVKVTWNYNTANEALNDTLYTYLIDILNGEILLKSIYVPFDKDTKGGSAWIGLTVAQDLAIPAYRSITISVYSIDALGRKSASAATAVFSKIEPPAPSFTFTNTGSQFKVLTDNASCQGYGVTHFNVYASTEDGFTPSSATLVGTKKFDPLLPMESFSSIWFDFQEALPAGTTVFVLVEASDSYIEV
jgi:predicted phage tail protein